MTQSMDYTGTISTKRLKNTGFTEDILRQAHARPGRRIMAVVELCVADAHNKHDAPNHVDFTVEQAVPFLEDSEDDFLRRLTRSANQTRILNSDGEQLSIDEADDVEPSVEAIIAAREATDAADQPHEYLGDTGDCDLCGAPPGNPIHAPDNQSDPDEEPAGHALPVS